VDLRPNVAAGLPLSGEAVPLQLTKSLHSFQFVNEGSARILHFGLQCYEIGLAGCSDQQVIQAITIDIAYRTSW